MKKNILFVVIPSVFIILLIGCFGEIPSDSYIRYIDKIDRILSNPKTEFAQKGPQIKRFIELNKTGIEKTLKEVALMSADETEKGLDRVRLELNKLSETITGLSQSNPEISENQDIDSALKFLKAVE